jgi:hypothetical protein
VSELPIFVQATEGLAELIPLTVTLVPGIAISARTYSPPVVGLYH